MSQVQILIKNYIGKKCMRQVDLISESRFVVNPAVVPHLGILLHLCVVKDKNSTRIGSAIDLGKTPGCQLAGFSTAMISFSLFWPVAR